MNHRNDRMTSRTRFVRFLLLFVFLTGTASALAQDELRRTFFRNVDVAKDTAEAQDARLLAPRNYEDGMEEYEAQTASAARRNTAQAWPSAVSLPIALKTCKCSSSSTS